LGFPKYLFNGMEGSGETYHSCDSCFTQFERDMIAGALRDAENMLATRLGYYLGPRYLTDDDLVYQNPIQLQWGHVIGGGIQGLTDVSADVSASDFTVDPATITIPAASFPGGTDEIYIVDTASNPDLEIVPDKVETVGTNYVIYIGQYKLIEWDDLEDQSTCLAYDANFPNTLFLKLADLTIYREYLDDSDQATITYGPSCTCYCSGSACAGEEYTGCVYVIDEQISKVRIPQSTYSGGAWSCDYTTVCGCYVGDKVSVNYQAGYTGAPGWEDAVMRLAHTYMITTPCGCSIFDKILKRDRYIPPVLSVERINCPFGTMDGAWYAWSWMGNVHHDRAFML
jgi:hypothetical protein